MIRFKLVRMDGTVLADNLLPSEAFRLIKEGKAENPFHHAGLDTFMA